MKKILIIVVILVLVVVGFFIYKKVFRAPISGGYPPIVFVGKTNQDYSSFVWVTMSNDKVVGAPATNNDSDTFNRKYISLNNGYVYGASIGPYGVPINVTIEDYKKTSLGEISLEKMNDLILDKNPYSELYRCNGYLPVYDSELTNTLNGLIDNNQLSTKCEKII